jgi:hypothetical protein
LAGDVGGANLKAIQEHLQQRRTAFRRVLDKGVTKDAFTIGEAVLDAYDAAAEGLGHVWKSVNG